MLLSIKDLIQILRDSVNVQVPSDSGEITDPYYVAMSDEDILRFIKLGVTRIYPDVTDLEDLPSDCSEYAIVLLAKIELYLKLAVIRADKIDLGADSAYIKNSQRFEHYMKLVEEARAEYESWLDNEGEGAVTTYEVLNSKYSHTKRYYENQLTPMVKISIDNITSESFDIEWSVSNLSSHFGKYSVYFSSEPIFNKYADGSDYESHLNGGKLIRETYDKRNTTKSIKGLEPNTTYYVLVIAQCRNGVWGCKETSVTTLEELVIGEEIEE